MKNQKFEALVNGMLTASKNKQANLLNVKNVKELTNKIESCENQRFMLSLELSQLIFAGRENFDLFCTAIQNKAKDEGLKKPTKDEVIPLVYGFEKSQFHKYLRTGKIPKNIVNKFNDKCEELRKSGGRPNQSIEALETWAKHFEEHKGRNGVTKDEIQELREDSSKEKKTAVWSVKQGNKAITIFDDNSVDCNFTAIEINDMLDSVLIPFIRSTYPIKKTTTKKETARLERTQKERIAKIANGLN